MNRQQLISDNMNLVYSVVSKEYPTYLHDEDIVQSGMLGLCKAAEAWDESKSKFSTYAWRCIRNEINNEFINRKPHSKNISLETKIGDEGTLEEVLIGKEDVSYFDDAFYDLLSPDEQNILRLDNLGYSTEEIAETSGRSVQKVRKTLRLIKLKWRAFNEN